jgi:tetratricopeptide (TPR) repeat protein
MGNELMKQGNYELAVEKYSLGISIVKDNKANYLNRALAYMKLNKFKSCVKDCSRLLELAEVFEEGYTKSKETNFKAFLRRAFARKELNLL